MNRVLNARVGPLPVLLYLILGLIFTLTLFYTLPLSILARARLSPRFYSLKLIFLCSITNHELWVCKLNIKHFEVPRRWLGGEQPQRNTTGNETWRNTTRGDKVQQKGYLTRRIRPKATKCNENDLEAVKCNEVKNKEATKRFEIQLKTTKRNKIRPTGNETRRSTTKIRWNATNYE